MKLSRNGWIDTLRGVAALMVAFFHFNIHFPTSNTFFNHTADFGRYGVQIFFLISGFCIQASAHRCKSPGDFFWQRFWRIYPPYLFSLIVLAAVAVARKLSVGVNDAIHLPAGVGGWLATLTLTTAPVTSYPTMNWVYWSLSYEAAYYAIIGLVLVCRFSFVPFYFLAAWSFATHFLPAWANVFFIGWWPVFGLGAALYEYSNGQKKHGIILMVLNLLVLVLWQNPAVIVSVSFALITILLSLHGWKKRMNRHNPLVHAGTISYSLYLLHVPIGIFLLSGLEQRLGANSVPVCLLFYMGQLAVCLAVSWAAYRWIEKPAMAVGKAHGRFSAWLGRKRA